MKPQRSEILSRMVRFLNLDTDGLRRFVLEAMVEAREFTVASLHESVKVRFNVSRKNGGLNDRLYLFTPGNIAC